MKKFKQYLNESKSIHFLETSSVKQYLSNSETQTAKFLINESLKSAKALYQNKISEKDFKELVDLDPSKTKKYIEKMCAFYLEILDKQMISRLINSFDDLVQRKQIKRNDITSYKNWEDFSTEVNQHDGLMSKRAKKQAIKDNEVEIILDNNEYYIISPKTHAASQIYGAGTRWCITDESPSYWDRYVKRDDVVFYFIITKKLPQSDSNYKIAIGVYPNGKKLGYDAVDDQLSSSECTKFMEPFKHLLLGIPKSVEYFFTKNKLTFNKLESGEYNITEVGSMSLSVFPDEFITINNYNSDFECNNFKFEEKKLPIKIKSVNGHFYIWNTNIESLENFPTSVSGKKIALSSNKLKSLEGFVSNFQGAVEVQHNELSTLEGLNTNYLTFLNCDKNKLKSLKGCPEKVDEFYCRENEITSLKGGPKTSIIYDCSDNPKLKSLSEGPSEVFQFICNNNVNLTSLEGGPKEIKQSATIPPKYMISNCKSLTSLKGAPEKIEGDFYINNTPIESLDYFPKVVTGDVSIYGKYNKFTEEEIRAVCKVGKRVVLE